MKNLEDKILKKVYLYETKRTSIEIIVRVILFSILSLLILLFGVVLFEELIEQKTFDLFQIFSENFEVITRYVFDVLYVFYQELPKVISSIFLALIIFIVLCLFIVIKKLKYFKNKIKSLIKFRHKKGNK